MDNENVLPSFDSLIMYTSNSVIHSNIQERIDENRSQCDGQAIGRIPITNSNELFAMSCNSNNANDQTTAESIPFRNYFFPMSDVHASGLNGIAQLSTLETMPKAPDKDLIPDEILEDILEFESINDDDHLTLMSSHNQADFTPLVYQNSYENIPPFNESNHSDNVFYTHDFYSNSIFPNSSYDHSTMAYDPMLYEVSQTLKTNEPNCSSNAMLFESNAAQTREVESKPIYLDFNINDSPECRAPKKRKREDRFMTDNAIDSNTLNRSIETQYIECVNEENGAAQVNLNTCDSNEAQRIVRNEKRERKDPNEAVNTILNSVDNGSEVILPCAAAGIDENIIALKTVIDQFNNARAQHILICKPRRTKQTIELTPLQRAQSIEQKLSIIDTMPIEIPLLPKSTPRSGRKQKLQTISPTQEEISFDTVEIDSKKSNLVKSVKKKLFGSSTSKNIIDSANSFPTLLSKVKCDDNSQRSSTDHVDTSLIKSDTKFKSAGRSISNDSKSSGSDSDDTPHKEKTLRKTLKCSECGKIFITHRSLIKHEKHCESPGGCQTIDNKNETNIVDRSKMQSKHSSEFIASKLNNNNQLDLNKYCDLKPILTDIPCTTPFVEMNPDCEYPKNYMKTNLQILPVPIDIRSSAVNEIIKPKPKNIVCGICNKRFVKKGLYSIHMATCHKINNNEGTISTCSINLRSRSNRSMVMQEENAQRRSSLRQTSTKAYYK